MDHAARGKTLLEAKKYDEAIDAYTKAIAAMPKAVDYYIARSEANHRKAPPNREQALSDADMAVILAHDRSKREAIMNAQTRRYICLFGSERYADSKFVFDIVNAMQAKDVEKSPEQAKKRATLLATWGIKINSKLTKAQERLEKEAATLSEEEKEKLQVATTVHVKNIPDGAVPSAEPAPKATPTATSTSSTSKPAVSTPGPITQEAAKKIKPDWIQSNENVTVTLLNAKGVPKEQATIEILERSLTVSFPLQGTNSSYDYSVEPLYAAIDPSNSSYRITPNKVEIVLRKSSPGKWRTLEGELDDSVPSDKPKSTIPAAVLESKAPAYPTSSRTGPKNWDNVVKEATRKEATDGKEQYEDLDAEDGGDDVNFFFKKLYKDADPDTRRAMMKSYQESNGTALSTNWAEVSKAPVPTEPPDGMEAKKYES